MKLKQAIVFAVTVLAGLAFTGIASAMGMDIGSSASLGFVGVGMAANYIGEGDVLNLAAPYAVRSGEGAQVGAIFGVSVGDLANGETGPFARSGIFLLTALSTATGAQGAKVYWDNINKRVDTDSTVGILIGALELAKVNAETTAQVVLNEGVAAMLEGAQAAIADIATVDAIDLASAEALANATKAKFNTLLAELRIAGIIAP